MGGYTHTKHNVCFASFPNNGRLNRVLEVAGVSYGPRPVTVSVEVLKKRKADAATKVSAKCPKVTERKGVGLAKVSGSCMSGGSKQPSGADVPPAMSVKPHGARVLFPRVIASAAIARIVPETRALEVLAGTASAKASMNCPSYKTVLGVKAAPSAKQCIITAIGVLVALSSEVTEESSLHDQAPEVQSKEDPQGPSAEPQARAMTASGPRPAPELSLHIAPSVGAAGASTSCFWII
jgi:hypothetical protein